MVAQLVDQLSRALDATGQLVTAVRDDQWGDPTPCTEWTVGDLVAHIITGNRMFASILRGEHPPAPRESPRAGAGEPGGDLLAGYREAATALPAAFGRPGVLEQEFTVPFGTVPGIVALHLRITEVLVHGWDLARATGQPARFPGNLAEQELAFSRRALTDMPPGRRPFGPPQPVADDAPAIDRLAACLGRTMTAGRPAGGLPAGSR